MFKYYIKIRKDMATGRVYMVLKSLQFEVLLKSYVICVDILSDKS